MVTVRIPPSPTGLLHLGTARTALFNYLFAKKSQGDIVFRWEDTDRERSKKEFETEILEGLRWLGMDFEAESVGIFHQTDSTPLHQEKLHQLWEEGQIFPCFTTPQELEDLRHEAAQKKQNFVFWSPHRDDDRSTQEKLMNSGTPYVWRLRCPKDETLSFQDLVRGSIETNTNTLGDFVVARSDGSVLYLLANVVDDLQQGVTHVIKGEDHISNTPKQLLLFQALKAPLPSYAHIPLVLDQQGKKLSKRNTDPEVCVLVKDFQQQGFLPEAVINGLAFLGWNPKSTEEIFSLQELVQAFDLGGINPAAAKYDFEKMKWFNNQWMGKLPVDELIQRYNDFFQTTYQVSHQKAFSLAREKARTLHELKEEMNYLIETPSVDPTQLQNEKFELDQAKVSTMLAAAVNMLQNIEEDRFTAETIKERSVETIASLGVKNGAFLWPFRVALSGQERSAPPFDIAEIIGKPTAVERLQKAIKKVG